MSIVSATLATATLLGLALGAGAIEDAAAGGNCGDMKAPHGDHRMAGDPGRHGFHRRYYGNPAMAYPRHGYRPTGMHPHTAPYVVPMVYWPQHEGGLVKTAMASEAGEAPGDIVEVAVGAGSFTTLVTALKAAELVETLKGEGPFTVFAPTDEAFDKIPKEDLDALLADKEALTAVLTYHVVPGKVMAADVTQLETAETVQGSSITIDTNDGVKVDEAAVIKTDILASNGVIHIIDTVIMPD